MSSIPGLEHLVKEGWEIVRFDYASEGEWFVDSEGRVIPWGFPGESDEKKIIVRKIPKTKQYRPFANAAEFKPHRDRWWKKTSGDDRTYPPCYYNDSYHGGLHFDRCFIDRTFDDGTPFGVEVTE